MFAENMYIVDGNVWQIEIQLMQGTLVYTRERAHQMLARMLLFKCCLHERRATTLGEYSAYNTTTTTERKSKACQLSNYSH